MQPEIQPSSILPGTPDGFERLWTPQRMAYINEKKPEADSEVECPFCLVSGDSDDDLVVHRGDTAFVILNLFPYNSGHVLVCPYRHIADYTELTENERIEIGELTAKCMEVIRRVYHPAGFNLGMNQGVVAGAGIAAHLHNHVIPRWMGDANFFPIIAQTKALPELLEATRDRLRSAWNDESSEYAG